MITGRTKLAAVMGWPVDHSKSPQLHGHWLAKYQIDGAYLPLPVKPNDLSDALRALPKLGFAGVNLTIPHKEAAIAFIDDIDEGAKRIGAVNTVVVNADGRLTGSSSDGFGFIEHLRQSLPDWAPASGPAVLLGAGGAARAIAVALHDTGVPELRIVNRNVDRGRALANHLTGPATSYSWHDADTALRDSALLVNTTSLGMVGQPPLELSLQSLPGHAVVYDIVYTPLQTDLLARAAARGHAVVDGLGMLLHQARPGFAAWFGVDPAVTPELRTAVLEG